MKRALSILAVLLTVASAAHVSVATHYCHGFAVATRVSLSGEYASCGMEETESNCPVHGQYLDRHCCDNSMSFYGIDNTTINTAFQAPEVQRAFNLYTIALSQAVSNNLFTPASEYSDTGPPLSVLIPAVDLPVICQFRL